jgi:hypothetical protein
MADISRARAALQQRILEGDGTSSRDARRAAYHDEPTAPARALLDKVTQKAAAITDADIAAALAAATEAT